MDPQSRSRALPSADACFRLPLSLQGAVCHATYHLQVVELSSYYEISLVIRGLLGRQKCHTYPLELVIGPYKYSSDFGEHICGQTISLAP